MKIPHVHKFVPCNMIFDVNINTFKRKAGYVSGVHITEPPYYITFSSIVSCESVHIDLKTAAFNDLDVFGVMQKMNI